MWKMDLTYPRSELQSNTQHTDSQKKRVLKFNSRDQRSLKIKLTALKQCIIGGGNPLYYRFLSRINIKVMSTTILQSMITMTFWRFHSGPGFATKINSQSDPFKYELDYIISLLTALQWPPISFREKSKSFQWLQGSTPSGLLYVSNFSFYFFLLHLLLVSHEIPTLTSGLFLKYPRHTQTTELLFCLSFV